MKPIEVFIEELKKEGLELGEESAKMAARALFGSIEKMVVASDNKYDDMLLPVIGLVQPKLMDLLEDINKADNK
jgi:hypothetical protein